VYLTGYTPYPASQSDDRLPHLAQKLERQIDKTALGAQHSVRWEHQADPSQLIPALKQAGYAIAAVEQTAAAILLPNYTPPTKIVLIVGREVEGIEPELLALTDLQLVIPMFGSKESFNVVQAAAMALYHCRFGLPNML